MKLVNSEWEVRIYINGVNVVLMASGINVGDNVFKLSSETFHGVQTDEADKLVFGWQPGYDHDPNLFNGKLDGINIWSVGLKENEVKKVYQSRI